MTDEEKEKTEKDFMEWLKKDHKLLDNPSKQDIQNKCERAYFEGKRKGVAEGMKEQEKKDKEFCEAICMKGGKIAQLEKEIARLKAEIAEQEETIDTQDDKINFYVAKMNESILKRQELEKENEQLKADFEEAQKHCKAVDDVNAKLRCCGNCNNYRNEWGEQVYEGKCENCTSLSNWEMKDGK